MLKRLRASSPPPSSSSVPFIADSPLDLVERHTKRRRTAAPVLDGTARGWANEPAAHDEDEEYTYSDDDIPPVASSGPQSQSEYTSTNTMLRELHTLHQHRLLFASPPATGSTQAPNLHNHHPPPPMLASPFSFPVTSDKSHLPLPQEHVRSVQVFSSPSIDKSFQPQQEYHIHEATRVAELYEGTNKYLGSLFLSRRRRLDSSDEIPGSNTF